MVDFYNQAYNLHNEIVCEYFLDKKGQLMLIMSHTRSIVVCVLIKLKKQLSNLSCNFSRKYKQLQY